MSCVDIRGCRIGEGRPKVILPIVERTEAAILEKAVQFSTLPADCVEWRADWFEGFQSPAAIARCIQKLRVALRDKLLLVTFRTQAEGGQVALSPAEYRQFLELVLDTDCADLLDIEFFTAGADLPLLVEQAHTAGVPVVCSSHDFHKTPEKSDIIYRLRKMQDMNADIPKIAVMPQNKKDVLTLLSATEEMTSLYADRPIITMSMAGTGVISRLCGEVFGSSMTFGAAKKASAPGQMGVEDLSTVLGLLHKSM